MHRIFIYVGSLCARVPLVCYYIIKTTTTKSEFYFHLFHCVSQYKKYKFLLPTLNIHKCNWSRWDPSELCKVNYIWSPSSVSATPTSLNYFQAICVKCFLSLQFSLVGEVYSDCETKESLWGNISAFMVVWTHSRGGGGCVWGLSYHKYIVHAFEILQTYVSYGIRIWYILCNWNLIRPGGAQDEDDIFNIFDTI